MVGTVTGGGGKALLLVGGGGLDFFAVEGTALLCGCGGRGGKGFGGVGAGGKYTIATWLSPRFFSRSIQPVFARRSQSMALCKIKAKAIITAVRRRTEKCHTWPLFGWYSLAKSVTLAHSVGDASYIAYC